MTTYVLMVFILASSGSAATSGHFYTLEACEHARNTITMQPIPYPNYKVNAYCLPEGGELGI